MDEFWPRFGLCSMSSGRTRDLHGGAGRGDHQHAVVGAEHFIVDVHADHGVRPHRLRALLHLGDGLVAGAHQLFLIALAAAAEHVTQARAKILEHVHTGYHFAEDDALVVGDGVSVDGRGGGDENHGEAPLACLRR